MVFVADDLAAWLIFISAEGGRKKLTSLVLGDDQERALRPAATEAVQLTAAELCPHDAKRAEELAVMVGQLFKTPVPGAPLGEQATVLEALQVAIAGQLKILDDPGLTVTVQSLTGMRDVSATIVAQKLTGHLVREIVVRGSRGGPLAPLANQLNHDRTYLQGEQIDDRLLEILALLDGTRAVAAAPVALAQLPAVTAGFTGRDDELAVLAGLLDPAGSGRPVVVSAMAGLAGVGKTTLAVQAGHAAQRRGWFGGGVLFVDLHGYDEAPAEPGQTLDALLRTLGVPAEDIPPTVEERAGLYRSALARISEPVLVIADNASSEAQVKPLLPGAGPHKVLVTSRNTLAGVGARLVDVTVLDDDEAVGVLDAALRVARPDDDRITGDQDAAGRLARVCGGLPLALQIVAALLKADPTLGGRELAEELAAESRRLEQLAYDGGGTSAPSVAAAFELSYRRLDEAAARVFRLLPVSPGPDVSTDSVAVLTDLPTGEARRVLAGLAAAHLAEAAPGRPGRWRMHDLVRLYAQKLSEEHSEADGREQARDQLLGYYLDMATAADDHLRALPGAAVPAEFIGRDGALAWLDAERASLVATVAIAADTGRDQVAMTLPFSLAEYFDWRRRFDDWLATATISLNATRRLGDRHREGSALNNLGMALQELRRFDEAITALQDAAAIFRKTGDRHGEGVALNNLGLALQETRRFDEAITALQDAAAIYRSTDDQRSQSDVLNNLGIALQEVRRFNEAITAHQDAAAIYRQTGDRHREGGALNNLGLALQQVRRFNEAITAHQDAAAIYKNTGNAHREGGALGNLGLALREVRRFDEAITAHQDAAAIYRQTGDRHREGGTLGNLGNALQEAGRLDEAIVAHHQNLTIRRATGDRHGEGGALNDLGNALREVRRFNEAITAHQDAAAIYRQTGDRHREGIALNNLGLALQEMRRFDEAITAHQDAAAIYGQTGDRHGEGMALNNLGVALQEVRRTDDAITACRDAAAIYRQTGDRHREGGALHNLGLALQKARRFGEAITAYQDAAAIFRETGDRHGEGAAVGNLGLALRDSGRYDEAVTAHQQAIAIFRETGDRHSMGSALNDLETTRAAQQI